MEMNLPILAGACFRSGRTFAAGERVVSLLVRGPVGEMTRYDLASEAAGDFAPPGQILCRWTQLYKPRTGRADSDRALKLTAENLFLTLADPATEPSPDSARLVQFLALMLERKRLLRPRGRTADGARAIWEHARTGQSYEIEVAELTPEFFLAIRKQLGELLGVKEKGSG
jgi:hypothetical protein